MGFRNLSLLFLFVFDTSPTWSTDVQSSPFKETVCNQCQQWCGEGGSWTVFQRRMNGDVDFYRSWADYEKGFGNPEGDFWLGLKKLHQMTKDRSMELEVKMITKDGIYLVAKYSNFSIGPGSDNYRLTISGFSGNVTRDGFIGHNNQQFSTKDADHDRASWNNCASYHEGGWWYTHCGFSSLNGNFHKTGPNKGIWWQSNHLRFSEMKFRTRL